MNRKVIGGIVATLGGGIFGAIGTYFGLEIWQILILEVILMAALYGALIVGGSK